MKLFLKILVCVLVLFGIVFLLLFERKDIPDIRWTKNYDLVKKEAGDLWLFTQLLEKRFGSDNYSREHSDVFDYLEERDSTLLVMIGKRLKIDASSTKQLEEYVKDGGEVLLISENLSMKSDSLNFGKLYRRSKTDTSFNMVWSDSTAYRVDHHWNSLEDKARIGFKHFYDRDSIIETKIDAFARMNSNIIYGSKTYGKGKLALHTVPFLFTNVKAVQDSYLQNFNKTLNVFNSDKVVLHTLANANLNAGKNEDSLLQYIMTQRALKYAYYGLLLSSFLFIVFASKRKQKQIKIVPPVKNTSLDYIHTTSELFMSQNQNKKLVPHLGKVYHQTIANKFFLKSTDPDFVQKLARKSRVDEKLIEKIEKTIANAQHYDFSDDQLISLYNDINLFHKNAK